MLERFFTDSYSGNKPFLRRVVAVANQVVPTDAAKRWLARADEGVPPEKITSFERIGIAYAVALRRATSVSERRDIFRTYGVAFNEAVLRQGLGEANTLFAFNGARELLALARAEGRRCMLDQTIAPDRVQRRLMAVELERWPGWARGASFLDDDSADNDRESAEWADADIILCPSVFVRETVAEAGGPREKCRIMPYGIDGGHFPPRTERHAPEGRPIRVLFAGEVGLRKGVPDLLEALRRLGPDVVKGRLVGPIALNHAKLAPYSSVATFTGSVLRQAMPAHYGWADVFVLPSICEGSATVLSEALVSGLPVICTPNSGPPPNSGGLRIVPVGDPDAIAEAILAVKNNYAAAVPPVDPAPPFAITAYGERLVEAITKLHSNRSSR